MKTIEKVQLISPPNDYDVRSSGSMGFYPNLAIVSLATALKSEYPGIDVEVMDGGATGIEEMLERVDADVIGISTLTPSYGNTLKIAERAKEKGSLVVLGNDHASYLGKEILQNRDFVDFVIYGDSGERSLVELVERLRTGKDLRSSPNLMFRGKNGKIVRTGEIEYPLESAPVPDRSLMEKWETFIERYNKVYGKWHEGKVVNTLTNFTKGCSWGEKNRCLYCDIYDLKMRHISPERVWKEIMEMKDKYGVNFIYEVGDSFTSFAYPRNKSFIEELVKKKPDNLNPEWFVYAKANELMNDRVIELLKKLNVIRMNIGLESGDDEMLKSLHKGVTADTSKGAAEKLAKAGMQMYISYILGAPGETYESLERTLKFNEEILDLGNVVCVDPSVLLPLPGSEAWNILMNRECGKKYRGKDVLDTDMLAKDWVKKFCKVDYSTIQEVTEEIRKATKEHGANVGAFGVRGF